MICGSLLWLPYLLQDEHEKACKKFYCALSLESSSLSAMFTLHIPTWHFGFGTSNGKVEREKKKAGSWKTSFSTYPSFCLRRVKVPVPLCQTPIQTKNSGFAKLACVLHQFNLSHMLNLETCIMKTLFYRAKYKRSIFFVFIAFLSFGKEVIGKIDYIRFC